MKRERVRGFLEIYEVPTQYRLLDSSIFSLGLRVAGKHQDYEAHLHLSHSGGAGVFIGVIFPFPSLSSREL